jgi:acetolactate synthase-1/2/3 large subunit
METKEIGREYPADAGVVGDLKLTLQEMVREMKQDARKEAWEGVLEEIRRGAMGEGKALLLGEIREVLDRDSIFAVDVNSIGYRSFAEFPCYDPRTFLYPCLGGALGWAFPAALGAKAAFPKRQVVCLIGDGGFLFNAVELATAMKYGINVVTIVVNDKALTSIKGAQQRMCEGRLIDTDLYNPDFVQFAQSFGAFGIRVDDPTSFKHILMNALKQNRPSVIELPMSEKQEELIRGIPWLSNIPAPQSSQPNKGGVNKSLGR